MSSRFDNKRLFLLLAGLITILILTVLIKIPKERASLKTKIADFDTVEVSSIMLYPKISNGEPYEFAKQNGKWTVKQGNIVSATQKGAVQNIFMEILGISPKSLVAKHKSKWKEFELTDSLATRVKFLNKNGKTLADMMIGKFSYKQVRNPYGGYGANDIQGTSYIRLTRENEVYGVDGFISFLFNRKFDDWRDKTFIHSIKDDITNISLSYDKETEFSLIRKDSLWYADTQPADSLNVADYLNTLGNLDGQNFIDNFKPALNPVSYLNIQGNNLLNISIKCYKGEKEDEYILNSSLNPDVYFISGRDGIFDKIFKPKSYFLGGRTLK